MWLSLLFLYPNNSISNRSCVAQHKSLLSITNHGVHMVTRDCASPNNIRTRTCPEKGRAGAVLGPVVTNTCPSFDSWMRRRKSRWEVIDRKQVPCAEHDMPARRLLNHARHPAAGQDLHNAIPIPHATTWCHCCGWQRWAKMCKDRLANEVFNGQLSVTL